MLQTTVFLTFSILSTFGTIFRKFTYDFQPDAMETRMKQRKKSCGTSGRYNYIIFFVFCLWELMVVWSFVGYKPSKEGPSIIYSLGL